MVGTESERVIVRRIALQLERLRMLWRVTDMTVMIGSKSTQQKNFVTTCIWNTFYCQLIKAYSSTHVYISIDIINMFLQYRDAWYWYLNAYVVLVPGTPVLYQPRCMSYCRNRCRPSSNFFLSIHSTVLGLQYMCLCHKVL